MQPVVVMAFRKRLKSYGYSNISIKKNEKTDDYKVTAFDVVADGGAFEESAKELFGDKYEDFMAVYSNSDAKDEVRKATVTDYVNFNNLDVKYYQDEGWDPVELSK